MNSVIKDRIDKIGQGIVPEGYKETKIGIIPETWEVKKLGELGELFNGYAFKSKDTQKTGIRWLKIANVGLGYIKWEEQSYLPVGFQEEFQEFLLAKDDLVMALTRPILGDKLKLARIGSEDKPALLNQRVGKIIPNKDISNNNFLEYLLSYKKTVYDIAVTIFGTDPPNISKNEFESIYVKVPSLPEQENIAEILSTLDKATQNIEKLIKEKELQKKGLMQQLLTGETRLPGFTEEWNEVKFGDLGNTFNGLSGKTKDDFGVGSKFLTYMNIFKNSSINLNIFDLVNLAENEKQNWIEYGDIFFTVSSETPNEVGMSSVLLDEINEKIYLNSFCFGFRLADFNTLIPEFARFYFRGNEFRREMYKLAQGSTRFNISKVEILKLILTLPSLQEQKAIADILSTADKEIELLNQLLENKKEEKKGLMQLLLTGIVRV